MQLMGLQANSDKSGVVGSTPSLTEQLRQAAGPLFACTGPSKTLEWSKGAALRKTRRP